MVFVSWKIRMFTVLIAVVAVLTAFQPAARADQITFTGTGGDTVALSNETVYSYPYYLKDNTTGTRLTLWCNDAFDNIQAGDTWDVQILHGWDSGFLTTMLGTDFWADVKENYGGGLTDAGIQHIFDADAWLKLQAMLPLYNTTVYQVAIWELFDPSIRASDPGTQADVVTLLSEALSSQSSGDYVHLTVYDAGKNPIITGGPDTGGEPQDFESVPDGGMTLMLLGGALVGLGILRRRFRA